MFVTCSDINIHVRIDGRASGRDLVLLHSLGTDHQVWDEQAAVLSQSFRVIRPDLRGHGLTEAMTGDYTMALLADDLVGVLDALGVHEVIIGGISIGGMIAQAFAAAHPDRARALILCDTAMAIPPTSSWHERVATVRRKGLGAIEDAVLGRWVTPAFIDQPGARGLRAMLRRTSQDGYTGCAMAIAGADLAEGTSRLTMPALVIVGAEDQSTPIASAEALRDALAAGGSDVRLAVLGNAAHIPTVEVPAAVIEAILAFLHEHEARAFKVGPASREKDV